MRDDIATRILALRPWDGLDLDAASGAVHPAHGIGERDGNVPNGDEFELPRLGHAMVPGTMLAASGASGFAICPANDFGNDAHRNRPCRSSLRIDPALLTDLAKEAKN